MEAFTAMRLNLIRRFYTQDAWMERMHAVLVSVTAPAPAHRRIYIPFDDTIIAQNFSHFFSFFIIFSHFFSTFENIVINGYFALL